MVLFDACVPRSDRRRHRDEDHSCRGRQVTFRRRLLSDLSDTDFGDPELCRQDPWNKKSSKKERCLRSRRCSDDFSVFQVVFPPARAHVFERNELEKSRRSLFDSDRSQIDSVYSDDESTLVASPTGKTELIRQRSVDIDKYMSKREMTALQERMNALTMIPFAFYIIFFLLSGSWLDEALVAEAADQIASRDTSFFDESQCISSEWLPGLHALPPLPVLVNAIGYLFHMPFSFIYHWFYAHRLPRAERTEHWSRRMDQAMLHFSAICTSYASSGRLDFSIFALIFNLDCIHKQFQKEVRPGRNQARIFFSGLLQILPVLFLDQGLFRQIFMHNILGFWLFGMYPVGGWSHSLFHLVMSFVPPLHMIAASGVGASQAQMNLAAACAAVAKMAT